MKKKKIIKGKDVHVFKMIEDEPKKLYKTTLIWVNPKDKFKKGLADFRPDNK